MNARRYRATAGCVLALACTTGWANDGALDLLFAGSGKSRIAFDDPSGTKADHAYAMTMQADGKALVLGSVDSDMLVEVGLARVQTNGVLDPLFDGDGNDDGRITLSAFGSLEPRGIALLT